MHRTRRIVVFMAELDGYDIVKIPTFPQEEKKQGLRAVFTRGLIEHSALITNKQHHACDVSVQGNPLETQHSMVFGFTVNWLHWHPLLGRCQHSRPLGQRQVHSINPIVCIGSCPYQSTVDWTPLQAVIDELVSISFVIHPLVLCLCIWSVLYTVCKR